MLLSCVTCPHCAQTVRLRQPVLIGGRVQCHGCRQAFTARGDRPAAPPPPPVLRPVPAPAPAAAPGLPRGLLVAGLVGAVLLFGAATTAAVGLAVLHGRREAAGAHVEKEIHSHQPQRIAREEPTPEGNDGRPPADKPARPQPRPSTDDRRTPRPDRPPDTKVVKISTPEPASLPRELQDQVNAAIDRGVKYLQAKQLANGTWENHHQTGMAALPALTLLECGVPATDARVQKAARYVRAHARKIGPRYRGATYELSLVLLFLDRLDDPADRPLMRTIALRLVAGQQPDGGWSYQLPELTTEEENTLDRMLELTRPAHLDRVAVRPARGGFDRPVALAGKGDAGRPVEKGSLAPDPGGSPTKQRATDEAKKLMAKLPPQVRHAPAIQIPGAATPGFRFSIGGSDNSNTQFATLALWAARRRGLPLERSLELLAERFRQTQADSGAWGYHTRGVGSPAMTGAGLLGLAVGLGLATDAARRDRPRDPKVIRGLEELANHVGQPLGAGALKGKGKAARTARGRSPINFYFLWTVERVGVLYNVREIGGKDWYLWGVELLLAAQKADGHWHEGNRYPGATDKVDTCLALLFLKRVNLAADLSGKLQDFAIQAGSTGP